MYSPKCWTIPLFYRKRTDLICLLRFYIQSLTFWTPIKCGFEWNLSFSRCLWPKYVSSEILCQTPNVKLLLKLSGETKIWNYCMNAKETFSLQFCFAGSLKSTVASSITDFRDPVIPPPPRQISVERDRCNHSNPSLYVWGFMRWNH